MDNSGPFAIATSTATPIPDPSTWIYRRNNGSNRLYYNEAHLRNDYAAKFEGEKWKSTTIGGLAANFSKTKWKSFPAVSQGPDVPNTPAGIAAISYLPQVYPEPSAPNNGQNKTAKLSELQLYVYETASFFKDRLLLSGGVSRYFGELSRTDTSGVQPIGQPTLNISSTAKSYGIVVKPIKGVNFFYSYNTSGETMPGSLSAGNPGIAVPAFKPSDGNQKEFGVKTSFLDDSLTFSVAHFNIYQSNYAVPNSEYYTLVAQGNQAAANLLATSTYLNVTSKGWELEGSYAVTKNLTVIGNYTNFEYRQPNGVRIRAVPDQHWAAFVNYQFTDGPLANFGISLSMDGKTDMVGESVTALTTTKPLQGVTETYPGTAAGFVPQQASYKYDGRTLYNLGVSYKAKDWTARVQCDNLLDEDYVSVGGSRTAIAMGNPREFRATFTYNF